MFMQEISFVIRLFHKLEEINEQAVWHISRTAQSVRELWSYVDMQIEEYKKKVLQIEPQSCRKETNLATGAISLILNKNEYDKVPGTVKKLCDPPGSSVKLRGTRRISVQYMYRR